MAILLYRRADGQVSELQLRPGVNRLGRSELNDVRVPDLSVSSNHCELRLEGEQVVVQDLGSTNGTAIDQAPIQQGVLLPGHTLRVGTVELLFQPDGAPVQATPPPPPPAIEMAAPPIPVTIPVSFPAGTALCQNHGNIPAAWQCSKCGQQYCDKCIVDGRKFNVPGVKFCPHCSSKVNSLKAQAVEKQKASKTFGKEMVAALKYPFRGEGAVILIAGTVFLTLVSFALRYTFLLAGMIFVGIVGYLMAYSQKVIQSSAQGEDESPGWPDLSDYIQDLVVPFFQAAALFAVYLIPYFVSIFYFGVQGATNTVVTEGLLTLATFMMPMAWLAISMHESVVGLSPHFVVPSIVRIFKHYVVLFLLLQVVVRASFVVEDVLEDARIPILGALLISFVDLYFLTVISRMLGISYFINRNKLKWF